MAVVLAMWLVLASRRAGDRWSREGVAIRGIQMIHSAEVRYSSQYGEFATSLAELGPPASGVPSEAGADLIDHDLATGSREGYKFTVSGLPGGYAVQAVPDGTTGGKMFYSDQTMVIREKVLAADERR